MFTIRLRLLVIVSSFFLFQCKTESYDHLIQPDGIVLPHPRQVKYQELETIGFVHFTVNTYTGREWGDGTESPQIFNPTAFDAHQWVDAFKQAGLKQLILTAKHHDGFCLWPSEYTEHTVKKSPVTTDIVGAVSRACQQKGIRFGLYLSPWDRHEPSYGTSAYNAYYINQLTELLTLYGPLYEVWFDGAKGPEAKDMNYQFNDYWKLVRQHQPEAVLFSDKGPDVRWIGNEHGIAGETNWSMLDTTGMIIGKADQNYLNQGDPGGSSWVVGECDVSIRPGWFYHPEEDSLVKSPPKLMDIYLKSVGRNGVLLLNIPPQPSGLLADSDIKNLMEFKRLRDQTFEINLTERADFTASSKAGNYNPIRLNDGDYTTFWMPEENDNQPFIIMDLKEEVVFDLILLQEPISNGQRVSAFQVEVMENDAWKKIGEGTTIGYKRMLPIQPIKTNKVKVTVLEANYHPLISEIGLYKMAAY
ncbi:MAG: alpha-L-fucosidase [Candidatus Cyclobacteriaceae bacterium M3_2C_046]